jgi:hypothetical protein
MHAALGRGELTLPCQRTTAWRSRPSETLPTDVNAIPKATVN